MAKVLIFEYASVIAKEVHLRYKDSATDRSNLVEFLVNNDWFNGTRIGEDFSISWNKGREERLRFWLNAYGLPEEERYNLLLQKGKETVPSVCEAFHSFVEEEGFPWHSRVCVMDFIVGSLEKDLDCLSQQHVEALLVESNRFLNLTQRQILAEFIGSLPQLGVSLEFHYKAVKNTPYEMVKGAYSLEEFSVMAKLVFEDDSWEQNRLLEKALESRKTASILATLALHFFTALRFKDMLRLPKPRLFLPKETLPHDLLAGSVSKADLESLVESWELEISSFHRVPGKTAGCREDPDIKVLVPVSLKEALGRILTLAVLHCEGSEDPWLYQRRITKRELDCIFDVMKWPDTGKSFSTRRANKAFLQGIQLVSRNGVIDAYIGSALFRGHSGSLGSLPPTTGIYLKDHTFSGKTAEVILFQLFERGTMGFVLTLLLERLDKELYRSLPLESQTQLIQNLGLEPSQAENVAFSVLQAQDRAKETVSEIFSAEDVDSVSTVAKSVLEKVVMGAAPAKQDHLYCVRIAAGQACPYQDRSSCLGCGAEIYTRSSFCLLVQEYVLLGRKIKKAEGREMVRLTRILEDGVLAAVGQILESVTIHDQENTAGFYYSILEKGRQLVRES